MHRRPDPRPAPGSERAARPRHFLMCRPAHFDVSYEINPWMHADKPVDVGAAVLQWERLRQTLVDLGHVVDEIDPAPGLPDMVFAANGATVVDGRVLSARFRHTERAPEAALYARWFTEHGYPVREAAEVNEGEGDYLVTGDVVLAGCGFRTDPAAHAEAQAALGRPVVGLRLVDPRFYHLDTALAVLDDDEIMYYRPAFAPESQELLARMYPHAVLAGHADAEAFGLNAICDGKHVVLAEQAVGLAAKLRRRGYVPVGVDLSELLKAGGSSKCCALEVRPGPARGREGGE